MMKLTNFSENEKRVLLMGCRTLNDVKCLNLSGMHLGAFQPQIFELLPFLEELDVSHNNLKSLDLPLTTGLIRLNCSHNELSDVQFLCSFPNLEELHVDENTDLTFADRYIAACLCPRLKCLDGSNIVQIDDLNRDYEEKLWPQVVAVWRKKFEETYEPTSMTDLQFADLRSEFTANVFESKLYGEDELEKFRDFKVKNMITEIMMAVRHNKPIPSQPKCKAFLREQGSRNSGLRSPCKLKRKTGPDNESLFDQSQVIKLSCKSQRSASPDEDNPSLVVQSYDQSYVTKDELSSLQQLSTTVVRSCTPSAAGSASIGDSDESGPVKVAEINDGNSDKGAGHSLLRIKENSLISEILTSPRKLQITLKKLSDNEWVRTSPSPIKSPIRKHITPVRLDSSSHKRGEQEQERSEGSKATSEVLRRKLFRSVPSNSSSHEEPESEEVVREISPVPGLKGEDETRSSTRLQDKCDQSGNVSNLPRHTRSKLAAKDGGESLQKTTRKLQNLKSDTSISENLGKRPHKSPKKLSSSSSFSSSASNSDGLVLHMLTPMESQPKPVNLDESSSDSEIVFYPKKTSKAKKSDLRSQKSKHRLQVSESQDDGYTSDHDNSSSGTVPANNFHKQPRIQKIDVTSDDDDSSSVLMELTAKKSSSNNTQAIAEKNDSHKRLKRIRRISETSDESVYSLTKVNRKNSNTPVLNIQAAKHNKRQNKISLEDESVVVSDDVDDDGDRPTVVSNGLRGRAATTTTRERSPAESFRELSSKSWGLGTIATRKRSRDSVILCEQVRPSPLEKRRNGTIPVSQASKTTEAKNKIALPPTKKWIASGFYRCHSSGNSASDGTTQVWQCAFEPDPLHPGKTKYVLAACGGRSVSFLDCSTGTDLGRYKHFNPEEELFALAWTTLKDEKDNDINILAVAGKCSEIHLIHQRQLICFASLEGNSEYIYTLAFHPSCPTYLCSGHADGTVVCWDITPPSLPDYKCECSKMFSVNTGCTILSLAFTLDGEYTVSGCEGGCFGWPVKTPNNIKMRTPAVEFVHPTDDGGEDEVDSLVVISSDIIATKVASRSCIYLWNLTSTLQQKTTKRRTQKLEIQMVALLQWSETQNVCMHMGFCTGASLLACGDSSGQIWLYRLDRIGNKNAAKGTVAMPIYTPSVILQWPKCKCNNKVVAPDGKVTMNKVAISSDGKYLGAVTDHNLVCIWK